MNFHDAVSGNEQSLFNVLRMEAFTEGKSRMRDMQLNSLLMMWMCHHNGHFPLTQEKLTELYWGGYTLSDTGREWRWEGRVGIGERVPEVGQVQTELTHQHKPSFKNSARGGFSGPKQNEILLEPGRSVAFTQKSAKIDSVSRILPTTDLIVVRDVCWRRGRRMVFRYSCLYAKC